jgi:hypothetical protein
MSDDVEDADVPDIFSMIIREMVDDDDGDRQNQKCRWWYEDSDSATQEIIDKTLRMICGWSFDTLVHMAKKEVSTEVERGTGGSSSYHYIWTQPDNPHKVTLDAAFTEAKALLPDGAAYRAARAAALRVFDRAMMNEAVTPSEDE